MSGAQALKGGKLRVVCMGCCILIDITPRLFRNRESSYQSIRGFRKSKTARFGALW